MPTPAEVIRSTPERRFVWVNRLPGSPAAARQAASRASKTEAALLTRVRKGLYYRGAPTRFGPTQPRTEEVVREVLGITGVGPAGVSAARAWGLTTQVPAVYEVATLRTVDPIPGVKQTLRKNVTRARLDEKSIALLELLRTPEALVEAGWPVLVERVQDALMMREIALDPLIDVARHEWNRSTRDNFARLLESLSAA
jgi:hypothetical protein